MSLIVLAVVMVFLLGAGSGFWMAWHLRGRPRPLVKDPGVYIAEVDGPVFPSTGMAQMSAPAVLVHSFDEFVRIFGSTVRPEVRDDVEAYFRATGHILYVAGDPERPYCSPLAITPEMLYAPDEGREPDETNVAKQWRQQTGAKWPPPEGQA